MNYSSTKLYIFDYILPLTNKILQSGKKGFDPLYHINDQLIKSFFLTFVECQNSESGLQKIMMDYHITRGQILAEQQMFLEFGLEI